MTDVIDARPTGKLVAHPAVHLRATPHEIIVTSREQPAQNVAALHRECALGVVMTDADDPEQVAALTVSFTQLQAALADQPPPHELRAAQLTAPSAA